LPRIKLTQDTLTTGLLCPSGKQRIELCDTDIPGFYVEVRATSPGHGSYYTRYKDKNGKTCHQKIGRTSDISLTQARKKAKELRAEIQLGADPRAEAKAAKAVLTFDEFFTQHYLPYAKVRKRSWKSDECLYRVRLRDAFGHKKLNQITKQEVQIFHSSLRNESLAPATCDHYIKFLRRCLNLALDWNMLETNQLARLPLFNPDNKLENLLSDAQLQDLLGVLRTYPARTVCKIALFLLSTGCRVSEALKATWSQIDMTTRTWRIPASNSKSKKVRSVPLNDSALEVLSQLDTKGHHTHVFVNKVTGKPYTTIMKVWERIRKKAGLPHLRIHDLRHQFASLLVNDGRSLYEVQQILGHSSPIVTQRYAHLSTKSLQEAAASASIAIKGLALPIAVAATEVAHVR
jgi:integrase